MKLMTRLKVFATTCGLLAVGAWGFGVINPGYSPRSVDQDNRQLVILIVETEVVGNDPLATWSQSLIPPISEPVTGKLWSRELKSYQGDVVSLGIDQLGFGLTTASIVHNGATVKSCWIDRRGSTSCQYRVAA